LAYVALPQRQNVIGDRVESAPPPNRARSEKGRFGMLPGLSEPN
jgi:hypothetical protein